MRAPTKIECDGPVIKNYIGIYKKKCAWCFMLDKYVNLTVDTYNNYMVNLSSAQHIWASL